MSGLVVPEDTRRAQALAAEPSLSAWVSANAGSGKTHVLRGMAIVTAGKIVGFQEGVIDMSAPGADYSPFSKLLNLVLVCEPVEGVHQHE